MTFYDELIYKQIQLACMIVVCMYIVCDDVMGMDPDIDVYSRCMHAMIINCECNDHIFYALYMNIISNVYA